LTTLGRISKDEEGIVDNSFFVPCPNYYFCY
jgi:hypothetical protein